ncbi:MAG: hypothetical protein IJ649_08905 [Oscillospiraceae bacterium]|nr:hypothetical protein [Oscillospiraceae bacterium]
MLNAIFGNFFAEDMQEIADLAKFVDKAFLPWYKGIVKSKRLQKRTPPAREARDAEADIDPNNIID